MLSIKEFLLLLGKTTKLDTVSINSLDIKDIIIIPIKLNITDIKIALFIDNVLVEIDDVIALGASVHPLTIMINEIKTNVIRETVLLKIISIKFINITQ